MSTYCVRCQSMPLFKRNSDVGEEASTSTFDIAMFELWALDLETSIAPGVRPPPQGLSLSRGYMAKASFSCVLLNGWCRSCVKTLHQIHRVDFI